MTRGAPDFSNVRSGEGVARLLDLGELAARLGSPASYDRRGDVYFLDSFQSGLNQWTTTTSGTGSSASLSCNDARTYESSCKLITGTTLLKRAALTTYQPLLAAGGVGIAVAWRAPAGVPEFTIEVVRHGPSTSMSAKARYSQLFGGQVYYKDAAGLWVAIDPGLELYPTTVPWHIMKLVGDWNTGIYKRLLIDNLAYDLSDIAMEAVTNTLPNSMVFEIIFDGDNDTNYTAYVDDVVITQNEP